MANSSIIPEYPKNHSALRDKILQGVRKAVQKLIEETARRDGELVISQNGQVVKVKAKDLLKQVSDL